MLTNTPGSIASDERRIPPHRDAGRRAGSADERLERREGASDMVRFWRVVICVLAGTLGLPPAASGASRDGQTKPEAARRDGQHDFDFNIGTWKTHVRRLQHPLSGSSAWVESEGTVSVRKIWNGRANLEEIEVD